MSDEYILLIREPEWSPDTMTPEEWSAGMAGHKAFQEAVAAAGERIVASSALQAADRATRIAPGADGAPVYTDGPFGETREVITGFYSFTAESPAKARELAALVPTGGWVELYPVLVLDRVE
ncbi:YciI family protein [Leifsonia sp. F6_8S_P_1B]|uniref:YciI family protein n=1 Tax=Leifsonia williamsii TaxID=3035919 RepID=A0ABT8KBS6_9MICO|nr:YciI family protein [Leifsonia williamsii]MDN4614919.1 YciI family protein [Leifsonia williamsii]